MYRIVKLLFITIFINSTLCYSQTVGPTGAGTLSDIWDWAAMDGFNRKFTVLKTLTLKSVQVSRTAWNTGCGADGTTNAATIDLYKNGLLFQSKNVNVVCGQLAKVDLNFDLQVGNYELRIRNVAMGAYKVTSDATEKSISGVITLTDNSINGVTNKYSGAFFNWVVEVKPCSNVALPKTLKLCKGDKYTIKYSNCNSEIMTGSEPFIQVNDTTIEIAPTKSTVYYYETPTILPAGTNIVMNGGFESGNTGFTTEYKYNPSVSAAGEYTIGNQGSHAFATCTDHTLKNSAGKMMIIDGATDVFNPGPNQRGLYTWCQKLKVYPNTNYQVEAWATTAGNSFQNTPFLSLELNSKNIDYLNTPSTGNWGSLSGVWNSTTNTSVDFCIHDGVTNEGGNAFLLDDISMTAIEPILAYTKIDSVVVTICDTSVVNKKLEAGIESYGNHDYDLHCGGDYYQCLTLKAKGAKKYTWSSPSGNMNAIAKTNDSTYQFCRINGGFSVFTPLKYQVIMESKDGLTLDTVLLTINRLKCAEMDAGVSKFGTLETTLPCGQDTVSLIAKGGTSYFWSSPSGKMNLLTKKNDSTYVFTNPNKNPGNYTYQVVSFWTNPACQFECKTEQMDTFLLKINTVNCSCADNDNDGICDVDDLDDDNDGILDEVECPSTLVSKTFQTSNGTTTTFDAPNADGGFRFDIFGLDNSFNLNVNGTKLVQDEIQCSGAGGVNESLLIFKSDNTGFGTNGNANVWTITGNSTSPVIRIIIDDVGNVSFWGKRKSGAALEEMYIKSDDPQPNKILWNANSGNTVVVSQKVTGPTNIKGEGSGVINCKSDLDNDGIINSFDTDSDGDGCVDAIEGGAAFKTTDLSGQVLAGNVDTKGVPIKAGASGQTLGSSQNASVQDVECPVACVLDSDKDGVCDNIDLDDDNDGILDTQECKDNGASWDFETPVVGAGNNNQGTTFQGWTCTGGGWINLIHPPYGGNVPQTAAAGNQYVEVAGTGIFERPYTVNTTGTVSVSIDFACWGDETEQTQLKIYAADGVTVVAQSDVITTVKPASYNDAWKHKAVVSANLTQGNYFIRFALGNFQAFDNVIISSANTSTCDLDGDGIINSLDTDSDGDGCADAIEGGATFKSSDLSGQVLAGAVDSKGVPVIAGANGQTVGNSQNVNLQDVECCTKPTVNTSDTKVCVGSTLTASPSTGGTWTSSNPTIATITNAGLITGLKSGTVTFTFTNASGCTNTTNSVTVNTLPTIVANGASICSGDSKTITASGAATYSWSPNTNLTATTGASITANPSTTTIYTVTGTDANGCVGTDTAKITVNSLPNVTSSATSSSICVGSSTTLKGSGANSFSWDNGVTDNVAFNPTTTKNYTVIGSDANGCKDTSTVTVTVNALPNVTSSATSTSICIGSATTLKGSGASSFTWDNGVTDNVAFNPTATKNYTVTGTDANGCKDTSTVTVTVNALPNVTSSATSTSICVGSSTTLKGSGASSFTWDNGVTDNIAFNPTATKIYTVTGTDANGCKDTSTVTVTVNALPNVTSFATSSSICIGSSTTLKGSGASSFTWDNGVTDNIEFNPTSTKTYTVTGTDANGCKDTSTVTVTVNALPTVKVNGASICSGNSKTLTASGASTYSWSPSTNLSSNTGNAVTANPIDTTVYTVTGTDINGCVSTDTALVTVIPTPQVNTIDSITACSESNISEIKFTSEVSGAILKWKINQAIGLKADSGFGDLPGFVAINNTFAPVISQLLVTPSFNICNGTTKSISIIINPVPVVDSIQNFSYCNNQLSNEIQFKSSIPNTKFTWNNNNTSIGLVNQGNGNIASFKSINNSNSNTTADITVSNEAFNCKGKDRIFTLEIKPTPNEPQVKTADSICQFTTNYSLLSNVIGSNLKWYNSVNDSVSISNTPQLNTNIAQLNKYFVTQTIQNCESKKATFDVLVKMKPLKPIFDSVLNICQNQNNVVINTNNSTNLKWYVNQFDSVNSTTQPIINSASLGVKYLWASKVIDNCESEKLQIQLNTLPNPNLTVITPDLICFGDTLNVKLNFEGTANFSLSYENQGIKKSLTSKTEDNSFYLLPNNDDNIKFISLTDANCVTSYLNFVQNFIVKQLPNVNIIAKDTVCNNQSIDLNVLLSINNTSFKWTNDLNTSNLKAQTLVYTNAKLSQILENKTSVPQNLTYTIKGYNGNCLGETVTKTITVMPNYAPSLPLDEPTVCKGDIYDLVLPVISQGYKLKWLKNDTILANTSHILSETISKNTVFTLQITDYCNNTDEQYFAVNIHNNQFLSEFKLIDSCMNFNSTLKDAIQSVWKINNEADKVKTNDINETIVNHLFTAAGKNKINVKGYLDNCFLLDTTLVVDIVNCTVETKNMISPNNDGQNDFWEIKGIEKYPDASLEIFDRWGQKIKVINKNIPYQAWDGKNNDGVMLEEGTYYYVINFPNSTLNIKGHINILK
jgi:gliding motility-associated-like protein